MASAEMVGSRSVLRRACWSTDGRIKGGPSQYPEKAATLAFFHRVPRIWQLRHYVGVPLRRNRGGGRTARNAPLPHKWAASPQMIHK